MSTNTAAASRIELPPPAWGSPAHQAKVRAEKEWVRYLRAHASQDADQRKAGKQTRYVEDIDVVIRYTLPPVWPEEHLGKRPTDDDKWALPGEDDALLIKILSAGYSPFFQRTGELSKVRLFYFSAIHSRSRKLTELRIRQQPAGVFKTPSPPSSQPRSPNDPTITVDLPATVVVPPPAARLDLEKGPTSTLPNGNGAIPDREMNKNVQPRRTYLPLFLSNFIYRIAGVLFGFIPQSIRRWWSPLHSRCPIGENPRQNIDLF